jgi:hypothetical protein
MIFFHGLLDDIKRGLHDRASFAPRHQDKRSLRLVVQFGKAMRTVTHFLPVIAQPFWRHWFLWLSISSPYAGLMGLRFVYPQRIGYFTDEHVCPSHVGTPLVALVTHFLRNEAM